jgi:hypothetical protein
MGSRYAILRQIQELDPERDHQRIVFLNTCFEFPWDTTRSLEFALFRTFCVPSISALLDRTGEFGRRAQKRFTPEIRFEFDPSVERGARISQLLNQVQQDERPAAEPGEPGGDSDPEGG